MIRNIVFGFILLAPVFGCTQNSVISNEEYYKDSTIKNIETKFKGKKNGTCISFYQNNLVKSVSQYKDDVLVGYYCKYYSNGQIKAKGYFDSVNLSSEVVTEEECYESSDGLAIIDCTYEKYHGIKIGEWEFYDDTGVLQYSGTYVNGKRDGVWIYWDRSGKIVKEDIYVTGELTQTNWK